MRMIAATAMKVSQSGTRTSGRRRRSRSMGGRFWSRLLNRLIPVSCLKWYLFCELGILSEEPPGIQRLPDLVNLEGQDIQYLLAKHRVFPRWLRFHEVVLVLLFLPVYRETQQFSVLREAVVGTVIPSSPVKQPGVSSRPGSGGNTVSGKPVLSFGELRDFTAARRETVTVFCSPESASGAPGISSKAGTRVTVS